MDKHLDIFGQQPFFTINIQLSFCFDVPDPSLYPAITKLLASGLERLCTSFPWLASDVTNEGSGNGNSGIFTFTTPEDAHRLIVKDHRHDSSVPTMEALRLANFPMSMLDEAAIAPRKIFPDIPSPAPAFLVQANFIDAGLILTFVAQHNTMDMTGLGHVVHLFSKACHGEEFSEKEVLTGNIARRNIVPLLGNSYTPGPELDRYIVKPRVSLGAPGQPPASAPQCVWAYFFFPPESLASLKSQALESLTQSSFVSTDDALTAFLWKSISRARLYRLPSEVSSTVMRAMNVRQHLGIPSTYPGPIQSNVYSKFTLQRVVEESLSFLASNLRSALAPTHSDLGDHTRAIATFLSRAKDKSVFSFGAELDLSADVIISSWAKVNCAEIDFNLGLGFPKAVRKPRCNTVEGLTFIMPKSRDGGIMVAACLRDEDMKMLRADENFTSLGTYVG
ncbi:trichothecene 3-O-acetyltransferase [Colletotrichum truncatum]|uniref:Trichothecene 3-O-acetyltransferase n=1 Tax=Colletotrichum truncatum TaxID=5467 RepID=A0ACC3Z206_COLTU|nr:trichothecene 3-O-acetyltransferase [Colletotrichum truncatum]KAF6780908.1 trichothecene 3-O-acetyltransferase [Colletotrichum truncatum]